MRICHIPPSADPKAPLPEAPTTGNWRRLPDGGLIPDDETTARGAGLLEEDPPANAPAAPIEGT